MTPEWLTVAVAIFAAFVSVISAGVAIRQARHAGTQATAAQDAAEAAGTQAREARRANEIAERQHARDVLPELTSLLGALTKAEEFLATAFNWKGGRLAVADQHVNEFKQMCDVIGSSSPSLPRTTSAARRDLVIECRKIAPIARSRLQGLEIKEELMAEQNSRYRVLAHQLEGLAAEVRETIAANERRAAGNA